VNGMMLRKEVVGRFVMKVTIDGVGVLDGMGRFVCGLRRGWFCERERVGWREGNRR